MPVAPGQATKLMNLVSKYLKRMKLLSAVAIVWTYLVNPIYAGTLKHQESQEGQRQAEKEETR
jgi:hypothetical protein